MPIKWKEGNRFKPDLVLSRLEKHRTINGEGASFSGFDIYALSAALHSMLTFPPVTDHMDRTGLIWSALSASRPDLSSNNFLKSMNDALNRALAKKIQLYHVMGTFNLSTADWLKSITVSGVKIEFIGLNLPKKYAAANQLIADKEKFDKGPKTPVTYSVVRMQVQSKSPDQAVNRALLSLDLLRALLCIDANPGMTVSLAGETMKPINVIRLGKHQTVHTPDGSLAVQTYWYEPSFEPAKIFRLKKVDISIKNTTYALRSISKSKFGNKIAGALVQYVRAFDERDPSTAFLRLWSALELLATPGVANYENLIDRCAFLFRDRDYHVQVLEHLREYRNLSVHAGESLSKASTNCFLLQGYFRELAWFLIVNATKFDSLEDAHEFLSHPVEPDILRKRIRLARRALQFNS